MSLIRVDKLQPNSSTVPFDLNYGVSKTLISFNMSNLTIPSSTNISSLTDNSTGTFTLNLVNHYLAANDVVNVGSTHNTGVSWMFSPRLNQSGTGTQDFIVANSSSNSADATENFGAGFGPLL